MKVIFIFSKLSRLGQFCPNFCQFSIPSVKTDGATFIKTGKMVNFSTVVLCSYCYLLSEDYKMYQISLQIVQVSLQNYICIPSVVKRRALKVYNSFLTWQHLKLEVCDGANRK